MEVDYDHRTEIRTENRQGNETEDNDIQHINYKLGMILDDIFWKNRATSLIGFR